MAAIKVEVDIGWELREPVDDWSGEPVPCNNFFLAFCLFKPYPFADTWTHPRRFHVIKSHTFNWKSQHLKWSSLEIDQETVPCLLVNVLVSPQPINSHVVLSSIYSLSLSILLSVCSSALLAQLGSSKVSTNWLQQGWWRLWLLQILRRVEGAGYAHRLALWPLPFVCFGMGGDLNTTKYYW